jgi:hypothetical protein
MSTSFGVIPTVIDERLTYNNIVTIAEQTINDYLRSYQLSPVVKLSVNVHDNDEKYIKQITPDEKFLWKGTEYAWFTLDKAKGGTEAYCNKLSETLDYWPTYIEEVCHDLVSAKQIQQIKEYNIKWYFKRSAGQSALLNIAYGHLAAALAKLTDGVIYSETAWDPKLFPMKYDNFTNIYFRPEMTDHEPSRKWAEKCLNGMRDSVASKKALL